MDKFDKFYKRKNIKIKEKLINTYIEYDNKHLLISNGYSVVYTKTIRSDFKELENKNDCKCICDFYNNCTNKNKFEIINTLKLQNIKNGLISKDEYDSKLYKINDKYSIDYLLLMKIVNIIGCEEVNIMKNIDNNRDIIIEVIGRNNQNGYLLPLIVI